MYPPQLPHQPPFVVQASVTPAFAPYLPLATGMLMQVAMQSANVSPFRAAFVQSLAQQNWQNPLFERAAKMAAQLGEYLHNTNAQPPEQALMGAADQVLQMLTADFVAQYPQSFPQLQDPATHQAVSGLKRRLAEVTQAVNQFYMRAQTPQYGGYQQPQPQFFGAAQTPYTSMFTPTIGPMVTSGASASTQMNPNIVQFAQSKPSNFVSGGFQEAETSYTQHNQSTIQQTGIAEELTMATPYTPYRQDNNTRYAQPATKITIPSVPVDKVPHGWEGWYQLPELGEWPKVKNPERPWDHLITEDLIEYQPAHQSDWLADSIVSPYLPAYSRANYVLFLARDMNTQIVEHVLLEWEDTMNYLEHELDRETAIRARNSHLRNENIAYDTLKVIKLVDVDKVKEDHPDGDTTMIEALPYDVALEVNQYRETILANSFQDAEQIVKLAASGLEEELRLPYEFHTDIAISTIVDEGDRSVIERILNTTPKNFKDIPNLICEIRSHDCAQLVNDRLTKVVNHCCRSNLGLPWMMDDFSTDIRPLIEALPPDHLANTFWKHTGQILKMALPLHPPADIQSSEDERYKLWELKGCTDALRFKLDKGLLFFLLRSSVTYMNHRLADFNIDLDTVHPKLIMNDHSGKLNDFMDAIIQRSRAAMENKKDLVYQHHYVKLKDGVVLELSEGWLAEDALLLRIASMEP